LIPIIYRPFLDDVAVRGPDIDYDNEEIPNLPRVRKYVVEYIKNLDDILYNLELAGMAINTYKLEWCKY
jgi:hypothetical protein